MRFNGYETRMDGVPVRDRLLVPEIKLSVTPELLIKSCVLLSVCKFV